MHEIEIVLLLSTAKYCFKYQQLETLHLKCLANILNKDKYILGLAE